MICGNCGKEVIGDAGKALSGAWHLRNALIGIVFFVLLLIVDSVFMTMSLNASHANSGQFDRVAAGRVSVFFVLFIIIEVYFIMFFVSNRAAKKSK